MMSQQPSHAYSPGTEAGAYSLVAALAHHITAQHRSSAGLQAYIHTHVIMNPWKLYPQIEETRICHLGL